jgi:hypothetical protein
VNTGVGFQVATPNVGSAVYTALFTGGTVRVGIATNTPAAELDITGTCRASTSVLTPYIDVIVSGQLVIGNTTATGISIGRSAITTTIFGTTNLSALTASSLLALDSSKNITNTTSGISPTFTTITASNSVLAPLIDTSTGVTLTIGNSTATAITLGKSGITTTLPGTTNLSALTASSLLALDGSKNITNTTSGLSPVFSSIGTSLVDTASLTTLGLGTLNANLILIGSSGVTTNIRSPILLPNQQCFYAYLSADANSVTGDGTTYIIAYNSTLYNVGSNFNTTTHTFTTPQAGQYLFVCTTEVAGLDANNNQVNCSFTIGGTNYTIFSTNAANARTNGNNALFNYSKLINLSASVAVVNNIIVFGDAGGTKNTNVLGGSTTGTTFAGYFLG